MISFLRERLQGIVAFSFLGLVALTFAFLGLPTFTQTFNTNNYAQIGDYGISQSEYFRTKSQVEQSLRDQFGAGVNFSDPTIIDAVQNLTNNSLIEKYTLINFFDDLDLDIPLNYVENELSKLEAFQLDGEFNQDLFKNYLINFNLTKDDLVEDFESDLKLNLAVQLLSATSSSYDKQIDQYLDLLTERRSITFANLNNRNISDDFDITEEALSFFYNENLSNYLIPEKRSFLTLDLDINTLDLIIEEEDVLNAYSLFSENTPAPEKRISHIMVIGSNYENSDEYQSKVNEVESLLETNDFSELVTNYSDDLGTIDVNGDLGFTNGEVFPEEFENIISSLELGMISSAISFEGNSHFLKVTELKGGETISLEDKRSELTQELKQIKFEDKVAQVASNLTFSNFTKEEALSYAETNSIAMNDIVGISVDSLPFSEENSAAVISTEVGSWSSPLEVSSQNYKFVYVYESENSSFIPFEEAKASVQNSLLEELKSNALADIYASTIKFELNEDSLAQTLNVVNVKVENFKGINRSTSLLSNALVGVIFNDPDVGVIKKELTPEGLIIYMVEDRMKGDSEDVSEEDRLSIIQESRRSNLQLIFNDLREKYNFDETISISNQFANQNS